MCVIRGFNSWMGRSGIFLEINWHRAEFQLPTIRTKPGHYQPLRSDRETFSYQWTGSGISEHQLDTTTNCSAL